MDRLLEHLIRSELNLVIREKRDSDISSQPWMRQLGLKKPEVKQLFIHAVPYEDFFFTLTYWRLPRLLPDVIKFQRQLRVHECAQLAAALTVTDFFRTINSWRKRKRISTLLSTRLIFEIWALKEDSHRARREDITKTEKQAQRGIAKDHGMPVGVLLQEPVSTHNIMLEFLTNAEGGMPPELKRHNDMVKDMNLLKVPQPINGIEVLKKMTENNVLVCQAIDPSHENLFTSEDALGNKKVDPPTTVTTTTAPRSAYRAGAHPGCSRQRPGVLQRYRKGLWGP